MATWQRALVTGASSGIGRAMALQLAADGSALVLVARSEDRLREVAAAATGVDVEVLVADLADPADLDRVVDRVTADPAVDLVVNNAGFGNRGRFVDLDPAGELGQVDVNCRALVALTHAAARTMVPRGRGGILNVSSVAAYQPSPGGAVYAATKAFVTSFSQGVHEELRGTGVGVSVLTPGLTRTEFQERGGWEIPSAMSAMFQSPEEVAGAGLAGVARNRAVVVSGLQNRAMVGMSKLVPDVVSRRLAGLVSRD